MLSIVLWNILSGLCNVLCCSPEVKRVPVESNNGRTPEGGGPRNSVFTWFMVLALLGVWSSVAVVWFGLVDYDSVIGETLNLWEACNCDTQTEACRKASVHATGVFASHVSMASSLAWPHQVETEAQHCSVSHTLVYLWRPATITNWPPQRYLLIFVFCFLCLKLQTKYLIVELHAADWCAQPLLAHVLCSPVFILFYTLKTRVGYRLNFIDSDSGFDSDYRFRILWVPHFDSKKVKKGGHI